MGDSFQEINSECLAFVYDAELRFSNALTDVVHRVFSPAANSCPLLRLTFGVRGMCRQWRDFLDWLPLRIAFLNRPEFETAFQNVDGPLPLILWAKKNKTKVLVQADEIAACRNLAEITERTRARLCTQMQGRFRDSSGRCLFCKDFCLGCAAVILNQWSGSLRSSRRFRRLEVEKNRGLSKQGSAATRNHQQWFQCHAPGANGVLLAGQFTAWREHALQMRKAGDDLWTSSVPLEPGEYQYRFIVDGEWRDDPECPQRMPNPFGGQNCIRVVPATP